MYVFFSVKFYCIYETKSVANYVCVQAQYIL